MTQWRDRLDLLFDEENDSLLEDVFLGCLLKALEEDRVESRDNNQEAQEALLDRCLALWTTPTVQHRLRELERAVWSRRLLPLMGNDGRVLAREEHRVKAADGWESRLARHVPRALQAAISGGEIRKLLPVTVAYAQESRTGRQVAGAVVGGMEDGSLGEVGSSPIIERGA